MDLLYCIKANYWLETKLEWDPTPHIRPSSPGQSEALIEDLTTPLLKEKTSSDQIHGSKIIKENGQPVKMDIAN